MSDTTKQLTSLHTALVQGLVFQNESQVNESKMVYYFCRGYEDEPFLYLLADNLPEQLLSVQLAFERLPYQFPKVEAVFFY